jgi:hypothetical protein
MAGRYNTWLREKLAARVEHRDGYWATSYTHYPIEFTVCYLATAGAADKVIGLLIEQGHFLNEADLMIQFPTFREWYEADDTIDLGVLNGKDCPTSEQLYQESQSSLIGDLDNDEGYKTWSPKTAAKYGFDYTGPGADMPFECALGNFGRGGKHICVMSFHGVKLTGISVSGFAEIVRTPEPYGPRFSNVWCRQLMGMMDEWDEMLTEENATRCGEFYMVDEIARAMGLFD